MLEALLKFAAGRTPPHTATAYKNSSPSVSIDVLTREFGSFRAACEAAGLPTDGMKQEYSDEELLSHFERLVNWRHEKGLNPVPSILDFKKHKLEVGVGISHDAFTRRFGDYKRFLRLYEQHHNGELARNALIEEAKKPLRPKREGISLALRAKVLHRDKHRCTSCGARAINLPDGDVLEIDHLVPVADGGDGSFDNLTARCSDCNRGKGARFQG